MPHLDWIREYLAALASGEAGPDLARFFTPDALQTELPNRLEPSGRQSDLAAILARSEQGRHVLRSQTFQILSAVSEGDRVAVEAAWTGTLAIPVASLRPGYTMRAHFAMFFEMKNGRIHRQRNYDCFEPF
jgi:ketosteroid isomerase-like protein